MLMMRRGDFRASPRMLLLFLVFGIVRIGSDFALFSAMETVTLSVASVLQMTAPFYVMAISFLCFGERITKMKAAALLVAFFGCVLVTDVLFADVSDLTGVALGAISGACYGGFVAGTKYCDMKGASPVSFVFYTAAFAMVLLFPITDAPHVIEVTFSGWEPFLYVLGVGLMITLVPYSLQAWALKYLDAGIASVLGVTEAVFAAIVGYFVFSESMSALNIAGMALVFLSIAMLNAGALRFFARRRSSHRNRIIRRIHAASHEVRTRGIPLGRQDAGGLIGIHQAARPGRPGGGVRPRGQDQAREGPGDREEGEGAGHQAQLPRPVLRELQLRQLRDQGEEHLVGHRHREGCAQPWGVHHRNPCRLLREDPGDRAAQRHRGDAEVQGRPGRRGGEGRDPRHRDHGQAGAVRDPRRNRQGHGRGGRGAPRPGRGSRPRPRPRMAEDQGRHAVAHRPVLPPVRRHSALPHQLHQLRRQGGDQPPAPGDEGPRPADAGGHPGRF